MRCAPIIAVALACVPWLFLAPAARADPVAAEPVGAGHRLVCSDEFDRDGVTDFSGDAWAEKFYAWRMDRDESPIVLYVGDRLLKKIELTQTVNTGRGGDN